MGYFLMTEADIKEAEYLILENNIYFTMKDINKALEEERKLNDKKYNKDSKIKVKTEIKSKKETEKKIYKKKEDNKYNLL